MSRRNVRGLSGASASLSFSSEILPLLSVIIEVTVIASKRRESSEASMLAHALAVMGGFTPSIHLRVYRRQAEGPNRNSVFSICRQIGTLLRGKGRIMDFLPFPPSSYLLASQLLFEFPFQFTDRLSFGACFSPSTRVDNLKVTGK